MRTFIDRLMRLLAESTFMTRHRTKSPSRTTASGTATRCQLSWLLCTKPFTRQLFERPDSAGQAELSTFMTRHRTNSPSRTTASDTATRCQLSWLLCTRPCTRSGWVTCHVSP